MEFNPPPNWPVKKGFTPPAGWEPDPSWGPPPQGWPLWKEKKKHTVRNVLLGITALTILSFVACAALVGGAVDSVVNDEKAAASKRAAANEATCKGKTYPDQQEGDRCADSSGKVVLNGVSLTATPLKRDAEKNVCTKVSYVNNSEETVSFNPIDWKIQAPSGEVQNNVFAGSGDLSSGQLIKGGKKAGTVCFDPIEGSGDFVLIYKPSFWNDERGIWLNKVG